MKKIVFLLIFILSSRVIAGFGGSQNSKMPKYMGNPIDSVAKTVQEIDENNFPVELTGHILYQENSKIYLFQDKTGTIKVEISENIWPSETIYKEDSVFIKGYSFRFENRYAVRVNKLQKNN